MREKLGDALSASLKLTLAKSECQRICETLEIVRDILKLPTVPIREQRLARQHVKHVLWSLRRHQQIHDQRSEFFGHIEENANAPEESDD